MEPHESPDNGSTINTLWRNFSNFYERHRQGFKVSVSRVSGKVAVWFHYLKRF